MDFNSKQIVLQTFLTDRIYKVPRYQREYSWTKQQLEDFYSDIVSSIKKEKEGSYKTQEYFFGTVILVGNMEKPNEPIEIIDGQQRITTITIFLSVLSDILYSYDDNLSTLLWKYIIAQNNDGKFYNVVENETAYPYFQNKIQMRNIKPEDDKKKDCYKRVDENVIEDLEKELSNEEKLIKEAHDFFRKKLEDENLSAPIFRDSNLNKIEKLKLVRDQLLGSTFVYIISENVNDVNVIFENINSKGLQLSALDLIKNEIFSVQNETVPLDEAKRIWSNIKKNLRYDGEYISVQKFYRYFWLSRYTYSTERNLYKKFKNKIDSKDYMNFLKELEMASKDYAHITRPRHEYFRKSSKGNNVGKDDLEYFVKSLEFLQNILNIEQVQVLLITLVDKYNSGLLSFKNMKSMVKFLEEFHFIYNGIMTERTNALVNKYGNVARSIYNTTNQNEILNEFNKLKKEFISLLPADNQKFISKFVQIRYSSKTKVMDNKQKRRNAITKYAIYKIEEILSEDKHLGFDTISATVEHIIPESSDKDIESILNVGNLIILESKLNSKCDNLNFEEKIPFYKKSTYSSVKCFLKKYSNNKTFSIEERAKNMANEIYNGIIGKW
jgi:uncharacterized protein with ParB-like and HNH nuclease domain